jgi:phage tail protein X
MSGFLEHITGDGERWDLLAWRYYGDPYGYERIIRANPDLPIIPVLPGGVRVLIPVLDPPVTTVAAPAGLPPWV